MSGAASSASTTKRVVGRGSDARNGVSRVPVAGAAKSGVSSIVTVTIRVCLRVVKAALAPQVGNQAAGRASYNAVPPLRFRLVEGFVGGGDQRRGAARILRKAGQALTRGGRRPALVRRPDQHDGGERGPDTLRPDPSPRLRPPRRGP